MVLWIPFDLMCTISFSLKTIKFPLESQLKSAINFPLNSLFSISKFLLRISSPLLVAINSWLPLFFIWCNSVNLLVSIEITLINSILSFFKQSWKIPFLELIATTPFSHGQMPLISVVNSLGWIDEIWLFEVMQEMPLKRWPVHMLVWLSSHITFTWLPANLFFWLYVLKSTPLNFAIPPCVPNHINPLESWKIS